MQHSIPKKFLTHLAGFVVLTLGMACPAGSQVRAAARPVADTKALGSRTAPITIEVFSDFQCPACKRFFQETIRPVIDNYVATGRIYLVHRDFPLPIHNHSREAARWANAAAQIGKFEAVEDALYNKQETWSANGNIADIVAAVLSPAELKRVRQWMQNPQLDAAIEQDISLGKARRVQQTPSLFVTHAGETVALPPGGVTYPFLKQYLDYLLRR